VIKNPLVSVLIPLYNAEKYFDECILSVINQTYKNIEIIIVDDGSEDQSLDIAKRYEREFSSIRVFTQKNSGATVARNRAFLYSKGEYIQYFDADDIMDIDKIYYQIEKLEKFGFTNDISVTSTWYRFYNSIDKIVKHQPTTYKSYDKPLEYLVECWSRFECMIGTAWLIPRKINETVGGWDESLTVHDDYLFYAKCAYNSKRIVYAKNSIVYWRQDNINSLSKDMTYNGLHSHLFVCNNLVQLVEEHLNRKDIRHALAVEYSKLIYRAFPKYMDIVRKSQEHIELLGFTKPLPMPTNKFRIATKLIGFYPTARLFGFKDKITKSIRKLRT
jgi:glycosyltransferase involved in cell wall biosynthesis